MFWYSIVSIIFTVFVTGYIAWRVFRYRFPDMSPMGGQGKIVPVRLVIFFSVLLILTFVMIFSYYIYYKNDFNKSIDNKLSSIVELKVSGIERWRSERLADGNILLKNDVFTSLAKPYFSSTGDTGSKRQLQKWLMQIQSAYSYKNIMLLDSRGALRLSLSSSGPYYDERLNKLEEVRESRVTTLLDFHRHAPGEMIHLTMVVPIMYKRPGSPVLGFIIFIIDPSQYLYPMLSRWPIPSTTAETLLVRRDGHDVLFLNELRFKKNSALILRIPLTLKTVPAVSAVHGSTGVLEGIDYRGVPVIASVRAVSDSPWYMVARMDVSEAYAPVRERFLILVILFSVLLGASGTVFVYFWREQRTRFNQIRIKDGDALRESEERFHMIFKTSPNALIVTNPAIDKFTEVNKTFLDLFDYTREEAINDSSMALKLWTSPEHREQVIEDFKKEKDVTAREFQFRKKNGEVITGYFSANQLTLKSGTVIVMRINDISYQKQAENRLHEAQEETQRLLKESDSSRMALLSIVEDHKLTQIKLEDTLASLEQRIVERTTEVNKARKKAVTANRAKSTFLSNMSHEIRTPLNAILGFTQLMMRDKEIPEKQIDRLSTINRSGEHLLALINDILEFSKIEAGRITINPSPFDFILTLKNINSMFMERAHSKQLKMSFDLSDNLPSNIVTDENKLRQVIINVLANAIKFTTNGEVTLRARRGREEGNTVQLLIDIEDTGPGMSTKETSNLFKAFTQTKTGLKAGGTGLGLALSMQYTRLMDGDITVKSEPGKGSCFSISFNIQKGDDIPSDEKAEKQRVIGLNPGQICRVLVVDDNDDNRQLINDILIPAGFQIKEASNGLEGIEQFKVWAPHIILMDMRMPVMNGYNAIARIRNLKNGETVPILAVTASAFNEDRDKVLDWGADGYLRKPFTDQELFESMKPFLNMEYELEEAEDVKREITFQPVVPVTELSLDFLSELPDTLISQMTDAALNLDHDLLIELIRQTQEINPGTTKLLMKLVKSYEYENLIVLLKKKREKE